MASYLCEPRRRKKAIYTKVNRLKLACCIYRVGGGVGEGGNRKRFLSCLPSVIYKSIMAADLNFSFSLAEDPLNY